MRDEVWVYIRFSNLKEVKGGGVGSKSISHLKEGRGGAVGCKTVTEVELGREEYHSH